MPGVHDALAVEASINAWITKTKAQSSQLEFARKSGGAFGKYVLKDEKTGGPVKVAPVHDYWHAALDAKDRVVLWSHVEAGKSQQLSIARPLWSLGRNPNRRIVIVSNTSKQAANIVRACGQYITKSEELRRVFPRLVPSDEASNPWTTTQLTVKRSVVSKDPSLQALGVHGNIMGARIDDLVLDDILDFENTRTKHARDELMRWILSTLIGRLTEDARVWCIGNAWHPEDAMHELAKMPRFSSYRFPVLSKATGKSTWPAAWPEKRIELARRDMGPLEFARQMLCESRDDSSARFKREWIEVGKEAGKGYRIVKSVPRLPPGYAIFHGVDLAVSKKESADLSVIFSVLLHPDYRRQVLNVRSGHWSGPDILRNLNDVNDLFGGIFMVENNAAQQHVVTFAQNLTRATVVPFTTGKNKADPTFGVEGVAAEMAAGRWLIPNRAGVCDKEVDAWVQEMLYYDPAEHTGDRLMASWFAREACRKYEKMLRRRASRGAGGGIVVIGGERPEGIAHLAETADGELENVHEGHA